VTRVEGNGTGQQRSEPWGKEGAGREDGVYSNENSNNDEEGGSSSRPWGVVWTVAGGNVLSFAIRLDRVLGRTPAWCWWQAQGRGREAYHKSTFIVQEPSFDCTVRPGFAATASVYPLSSKECLWLACDTNEAKDPKAPRSQGKMRARDPPSQSP